MATVTIKQPKNATIHVYTPQKNGGVDHTSTFTVDENTTYEAEDIGIEREVASKDLRYIYLY